MLAVHPPAYGARLHLTVFGYTSHLQRSVTPCTCSACFSRLWHLLSSACGPL